MAARILSLLLLLSACGTPNETDPGSVEREPLSLGSQKYSLPIGADGFVQRAGTGANWGFDPGVWKATIGQVGTVTPVGRPVSSVVIRADLMNADEKASWPSGILDEPLDRGAMQAVDIDGLTLYRSAEDDVPMPSFYLFVDGLDGFAQCGSAADKSPNLDRCRLSVRDGDVLHSFPIAKGQLPLASAVSRAFLATIKA